jgi:hypothetical protein
MRHRWCAEQPWGRAVGGDCEAAPVTEMTLEQITAAIRQSWGADTCAPEDLPRWSPENPARGQCGVTALVVNDLLGGALVVGEVYVDGRRVDYHWWNLLDDGTEVDLTREQFEPQEQVVGAEVLQRPRELRRMTDEYDRLRSRVMALLERAPV